MVRFQNARFTNLTSASTSAAAGTKVLSVNASGDVVLVDDALGAAGGGITSLGGLTAATQTFANGFAGTTPAWNSAGSTHTLNIPLASTASVTAGLLSNTDYTAFSGKINLTSLSGSAPLTYNNLT